MFLHEALLDGIVAGDTALPCTDFAAAYHEICQEKNGQSILNYQFKVSGECVDEFGIGKMLGECVQ